MSVNTAVYEHGHATYDIVHYTLTKYYMLPGDLIEELIVIGLQ